MLHHDVGEIGDIEARADEHQSKEAPHGRRGACHEQDPERGFYGQERASAAQGPRAGACVVAKTSQNVDARRAPGRQRAGYQRGDKRGAEADDEEAAFEGRNRQRAHGRWKERDRSARQPVPRPDRHGRADRAEQYDFCERRADQAPA